MLYGVDGAYAEFLFEHFQHIGGEECRKCRTGVDVLDSE